jgi:hypothetical protein
MKEVELMSYNIQFNYSNTHFDLYLPAVVLYQALEITFHCQLRLLQRLSPFFSVIVHYIALSLNMPNINFENLFLLITALDGPAASWPCP